MNEEETGGRAAGGFSCLGEESLGGIYIYQRPGYQYVAGWTYMLSLDVVQGRMYKGGHNSK